MCDEVCCEMKEKHVGKNKMKSLLTLRIVIQILQHCNCLLCHVILRYIMICYVMLCYVMLCYVMSCYVRFCLVLNMGDNGIGIIAVNRKFFNILLMM